MDSGLNSLSEIRKKKKELEFKLKTGCLPVVQSIASDPGSIYLDETYAHLVHFIHHHEEEALLPLAKSLFALNKMLIDNRDYYQNQVRILSGGSAQASKDFELAIHFTNLEQAYLETGLIPVILQISKKMKYHEFWKENFRRFNFLLEFLEQDLMNFDELAAHFTKDKSGQDAGIEGKIVSVNEIPIPKKAARLSLSKEFCTLGCSFSSFERRYFSVLESKQENQFFVSKRQTKWININKSEISVRLGLKETGMFKLSLLAADDSKGNGNRVLDEARLLIVDREDEKSTQGIAKEEVKEKARQMPIKRPDMDSEQLGLLLNVYNSSTRVNRQEFNKNFKYIRFGVANVMQRREDFSVEPDFQSVNDGDYWAINIKGLPPNNYAVVPRFGLVYQESNHGPGSMGDIFDSNFDYKFRYRRIIVESPAIFQFIGGNEWSPVSKGKLRLEERE